jgi:hypothetical protein
MWTRVLVAIMSVGIVGGGLGGIADAEDSRSTLEFFSPKIDLSCIRFVYQWDTGFYVELSNEQSMIKDDFTAAFPDLSFEACDDLFYGNKQMTKKQKRYLQDHIPETLREQYAVYFPGIRQTGVFNLSAFLPKPRGAAGSHGFFGKLEARKGTVPPTLPKDGDIGRDVTALAFPCNVTPGIAKAMDEPVTDPETIVRVAQVLSRVEEFKEQSVYECRRIYFEYPDVKGYIAHVRGAITAMPFNSDGTPLPEKTYTYHPSYLFCLVDFNGTLELAPFEKEDSVEYADYGGLMIEIGDDDGPACDTTPWNTRVHVLPDLDGDRACELFIDTTVAQIFRIEHRYDSTKKKFYRALVLVQSSYYGP